MSSPTFGSVTIPRERGSVPGTGDNSVCAEARRTTWEIRDTSEAGEGAFIQMVWESGDELLTEKD